MTGKTEIRDNGVQGMIMSSAKEYPVGKYYVSNAFCPFPLVKLFNSNSYYTFFDRNIHELSYMLILPLCSSNQNFS